MGEPIHGNVNYCAVLNCASNDEHGNCGEVSIKVNDEGVCDTIDLCSDEEMGKVS